MPLHESRDSNAVRVQASSVAAGTRSSIICGSEEADIARIEECATRKNFHLFHGLRMTGTSPDSSRRGLLSVAPSGLQARQTPPDCVSGPQRPKKIAQGSSPGNRVSKSASPGTGRKKALRLQRGFALWGLPPRLAPGTIVCRSHAKHARDPAGKPARRRGNAVPQERHHNFDSLGVAHSAMGPSRSRCAAHGPSLLCRARRDDRVQRPDKGKGRDLRPGLS